MGYCIGTSGDFRLEQSFRPGTPWLLQRPGQGSQAFAFKADASSIMPQFRGSKALRWHRQSRGSAWNSSWALQATCHLAEAPQRTGNSGAEHRFSLGGHGLGFPAFPISHWGWVDRSGRNSTGRGRQI